MNIDLRYQKHFKHIEDGELRGEENTSTKSLVDKKGYMPLAKQVERALLAGERLEAFRRGEFDSFDDNFNGEPSPLQDPDFIPSTDMDSVIRANTNNLKTALDAASNDNVNIERVDKSNNSIIENSDNNVDAASISNPDYS